MIALHFTLIIRIITLAERQRSDYSRIYGYAVASILFFHVTVNIGMALGLLPVIGIPLPFLAMVVLPYGPLQFYYLFL